MSWPQYFKMTLYNRLLEAMPVKEKRRQGSKKYCAPSRLITPIICVHKHRVGTSKIGHMVVGPDYAGVDLNRRSLLNEEVFQRPSATLPSIGPFCVSPTLVPLEKHPKRDLLRPAPPSKQWLPTAPAKHLVMPHKSRNRSCFSSAINCCFFG